MPKATKAKRSAPKTPAKKTSRKAAPVRPAPQATPVKALAPMRLGDELVKSTAPGRGPVSVILAKTDIAGGRVNIKPQKTGPLRMARGQVLHVKHAYRLQEQSTEREEYRFLLRSKLGNREHAPSLARHGDQWGVSEDINGYLQHEYKLDQPGTHVLNFDLGAEYTVMSWSDTAVKAMDRKDLSGQFEIIVD